MGSDITTITWEKNVRFYFCGYYIDGIMIVSATKRRKNKNTVVPVGPPSEKLNIFSNVHGCTQKGDFFKTIFYQNISLTFI